MKKRFLSFLMATVMLLSLCPVTAFAANNGASGNPDAELPFTPWRMSADEELYFLTRRGNGNIKIGDELAWIADDTTPDEFISVGVPENSGIVKVVEKSDWDAYCTDKVDFYLDVLKSGHGFDGCPHGTLNFDCAEYNCWWGGVQHLKGVAYDYSAKYYYSSVKIKLNENGLAAADKTVQLYDGTDYFDLTNKGNGVYESNTVFLGKYIICVDGKLTNQGVEVDNKTFGNGYFCDVVEGKIVRNDDSVHATAYYSGYEYEVERYVYDYDISVYYNGELSDALGTLTFVTSGKAHTLTKTDAGRYKGSIIFPNPIESENVNLCLGNTQTGAYFQTVRNSDEEYTNNSIKIEYYDETVTLKVDGEPFSGRLVGFDNGSIQYLRETDENGVITLPVKLVRDGETEMPYTVSVYGVTDNLATPTQLSLGSRSAELNYVTVSFITDDETKPYRTQYVRSGSAPNKVGAAVMDGLSFSCWSLTPWDKEEDIDTVEKFDFSTPVTAACKVYAHSTVPVLDIYDTSVGTDYSGNIVDTGSATAFRLPAVTIAGFTSGNASIQSFSLELTNIDKVYFYDTSDVTIATEDGSEPQSDNGGYSTTAKKVAVSFKQMVSMSVAQEYIRNNVVFVPTSGETAEINLIVSNEVISVEDKSTVEQSKYSDTKWKKLSEVSGNVLTSGFYYVDKNITKAASSVNTNGLVINGTVYLYIPEGKTLTATGYAGYFKADSGSTLNDVIYPGTAGILLLEGNSLYVYGKGTLKAQGGKAGDGSNGYDATTTVDNSSWAYVSSGTGFGGRGGSGAGAGIGTNGAVLDPKVDKRLSGSNFSMDLVTRGGEVGYDGPDSKAVTDNMGALYIAETVTVDAHGGAAGKNGTAGGKAGENKINVSFKGGKISVGAGGGGGAGYGGHAGADIGRGGATGASGGSGGSGGLASGSVSGNAGGGGKGAVNGSGTQSGTGGAGGKAGADNNPKVGESVTPGVPSVTDGHEFNYTVTFDGSGQAAIPYFMEEKEITVPDYAGDLGANELCLGWKVKTYGNTFGTASAANPLTTAENTVYVPGSKITLSASTYGDIVFVPIISSLPGVTASDTLSLTSAGTSELYTYTLELKCNGDLADLGTLVFTDSSGKKYYVNSASGDDAGKYELTLSSEVSIVKIELDGKTLFADDLSTPVALNAGESKTASIKSMEIAVSGKDAAQVSVSGDYSLEYSETLSTEGTSVFVVYAQTDDVNLYNITVDNEAIPASVAQAKFGTRATVAYSTVDVSVTTNMTDPLSLCLKADGGVTVPLVKSGATYSATVLSTGDTEYTLYINDSKTDVKVKLNQVTVDAVAEYYKISVVSKVNGLQGATDHTIAVNGVNAVTLDNVSFEAFVLSDDECTVTSNGAEVAKVTPSAALGSTDVNYYTVTYATGTDCTGTLPVDNTLYLAGQEATIAGLGGLTATSAGYYVAGWQLGDKVYNEGDTVVVTGKLTLTALAAQDNLIIHYVDHFGELGTVSHLPLTQKITVAEMNGLKSSFTDGLVKYNFIGWTLDEDTTNKIYSIYEETEFTPEGLLEGADTPKNVTFRAVYDVEYLKGITIEAALPEGKTVQGLYKAEQTFTIDYKITKNDGIHQLVLLPEYDRDAFSIETVTVKNDTGLGVGTVTDLTGGNYRVNFDTNTLFSGTGSVILSVKYKVKSTTVKGDYTFGFTLAYQENTLNSIVFDGRSYAIRNETDGTTASPDPSREVKITADNSKITVRILDNATITIPENQSVEYFGNAVSGGHAYLPASGFVQDTVYYTCEDGVFTEKTGVTAANFADETLYVKNEADHFFFHYSGYGKQKDCTQDQAQFTVKWYDKDGQPLTEAPQNVGNYYIGVSASASDYFAPVAEVKKAITITKATYDMSGVTFDDAENVYDGAAHHPTITGTLPTGKDNIQVTVNYSEGQTDVGEKTVTATFATTSTNYNVPEAKTAKQTITAAEITNISVSQTGTLTYTGQPQTATVSASAVTVNDQPTTFTYCDTETGTYTASVPSFTTTGEHTVYYKVSAPNHVETTGSFTVSIGKASLTVTAKNKSITYGGVAANDGVEYSGFVNGDTASVLGGTLTYAYKVSGTTTDYTTSSPVGTYDIIPSGLTSDNYEITFAKGTLTVAALKIAKPTADTNAFIYSGHEQTYTPVGFNTDTMEISGNKQINANETGYTVTVTPKDNYAWSTDGDCEFTWVIGKKVAELQWTTPTNLVYSHSAKEPKVAVTNLINDDECNVIAGLTATKDNIKVGTFTFTATALTNGNYKLPDNATSPEYTITKAAQTLLSSRVFTTSYDGAHNPVITRNTEDKREDNSLITYEVSADKSTILDNMTLTAGQTYYVRKGGNDNYEPSNWVTFTVPAQAQYTVRLSSTGGGSMEVKDGGAKVSNNTKVYTGTVLTLSATPADKFGFTAWYANDVKLSGTTYTITGDVTLKAVFTRTGYDTAEVPVPENFTYDGNEHTGFTVPVGAHYTAAGTLSATNAGAYSVTFKLKEGCLWEDGTGKDKVLTWKISKAAQAKPALNPAQVNAGQAVAVTPPLDNLKMVSPSGEVAAVTQNITPEQVGLYEFYYAGDANHYPSGSVLVKVVAPITVKTQQPTAITKDSAVLHGTVTGEGAPATVSYEYGKAGASEKTTVTGGSISGLTADTEYSYRAFVTVGSKTYYGETVTFRTAKELKKEPTGGVNVTVELPEASSGTVSVENGNTVIKSVGFTDKQNPTASFEKLPDGYYNVVLRVEDYVETRMIAVENGQVQTVNFFVPEGSLRTIVEIANPETPKVAVEGLGSVIEAQNQDSGTDVSMEAVARGEQDVEVSLSVEKNNEAEGKDSINYALGSGEKLDTLLDISLLMTVSKYKVTDTERTLTGMEKQDIGKTNQSVLEIVIPYNTNGGTTMYRYHDGVSEKLTKLSARPVGDFADGTYYVDNGYIFLYASGFSTYAIAETEVTHGGHGGSANVISAPTGDAGLALYAALSISSVLGMGWISRKKRNNQ